MEPIIRADRLIPFPEERKGEVDRLLKEQIAANPDKIVVLDDDPTGVQTVFDIDVYTDWSVESLREGFADSRKMFFILTNSRGLTARETTAVHRQIVRNVAQVCRETGMGCFVISRSDSTLRGHYPLETQLIREGLEAELHTAIDGEVLCPFFREGGRFTIDDVHYVRYGDELVPAAQTEFARDKTFGYSHSNLRAYIEEKTEYRAEDVVSITLDELRACDYDAIEQKLLKVSGFGKIVVNAMDPYDVKVFAVALYRAMAKGRRFCFRCAAALAQTLGGVPERPLLTRAEMVRNASGRGGMVVVGSHTQKTTAQLRELLKAPGTEGIEMNSDLVLEQDGSLEREAEAIVRRCEALIERGRTPVVYTRRTLLTVPDDTPEKALKRSVRISEAVQSLVGGLGVTPAFVVAKGGITSSDVGTKALRVRRARVLGQIRPGIPVWQTGEESRFPGVAYVIFPGNVGTETTLREAVEILMGV